MKNNPSASTNRPGSPRSAAILVVMAIAIFVLLGFAVVAIDLSNLYVTQAELEVAADAAASAGAIELPDTSTASSMAVQFAGLNMSSDANGNVLLEGDVEVGYWDTSTRTFSTGDTRLNAVRVTTRRSQANGNPVSPIFGWILGSAGHDLQASAVALQLPLLPGGLTATGDISLSGTVYLDSYDSTQGAYDPATAGSEGNVTTEGNVSIGGNVTVNGDVSGSSVSAGGSSSVTGDTSGSVRTVDWPSIDTTAVENDNDNDQLPLIKQGNKFVSPLDGNRNFSLSSNANYDIPPGTYYFNNLSLSGQATMNLSGPTIFYLTGDLDTSGGDVVNASQDPKNLVIFMTGGSAQVNSSVDWYGIIYAPDTDITLNGSANFFGAVIGATIDGSGSVQVHYDLSSSVVLEDAGLAVPKHSSLVN